MNFKSTVFVQRVSYLPIPIEYTIRTEILSSFHSTYLKKSQILENRFFFTRSFFFSTPKIFNSGIINDAVENRKGGFKSPSHGLFYPP